MQGLYFRRIGENIRTRRIQQGLTQEYIATQAGGNVPHISNIENDRVKVSLTVLVAICNVLGVTVDHILEREYTAKDAMDQEILKELSSCTPEVKEKVLRIIQILR